jgi:hypothetical protein
MGANTEPAHVLTYSMLKGVDTIFAEAEPCYTYITN